MDHSDLWCVWGRDIGWWFCDDCLTFAWIAQFPLVFQAMGPSQRDSRANSDEFQKKKHQNPLSDG